MTTALEDALDRALQKAKPGGIGADPVTPKVTEKPEAMQTAERIPDERDRRIEALELARAARSDKGQMSLMDKVELVDFIRPRIAKEGNGWRYGEGWSDEKVAISLQRFSDWQVSRVRKEAFGELVRGRVGPKKSESVPETLARIEEKLDRLIEMLK